MLEKDIDLMVKEQEEYPQDIGNKCNKYLLNKRKKISDEHFRKELSIENNAITINSNSISEKLDLIVEDTYNKRYNQQEDLSILARIIGGILGISMIVIAITPQDFFHIQEWLRFTVQLIISCCVGIFIMSFIEEKESKNLVKEIKKAVKLLK